MKLYIDIKEMTFDEENNEIEHKIILGIELAEFYDYDYMIKLPDDDKFIKDTLETEYIKNKDGGDTAKIKSKSFKIREEKTWWSFPLYEIIDNKIVPFNYTKYSYFLNTKRRNKLAMRINELYNPPSEAKILRKTFKHIMDTLKIDYPDFFKKYNDKIEEIINKNPKGEINGRVN